MYTVRDVENKRKLAAAAGLAGRELLDDTAAVMLNCNGIGAAWMGPKLRALAGAVNPALVIVADVHDLEYANGGGIADRWRADWRFLVNGIRMAHFRRSWWAAASAVRLFAALRIGGAAAFGWRKKKEVTR